MGQDGSTLPARTLPGPLIAVVLWSLILTSSTLVDLPVCVALISAEMLLLVLETCDLDTGGLLL